MQEQLIARVVVLTSLSIALLACSDSIADKSEGESCDQSIDCKGSLTCLRGVCVPIGSSSSSSSSSSSGGSSSSGSGGGGGGACASQVSSGIQCQVVADATKCGRGQYFSGAFCNQIDCDTETETCRRL